MESTSTKVSAIIAMSISLISFCLITTAFVISVNEPPVEMGVSRSFAFWVFGMIAAYISLFFYFVDAIFSIIKVFMKIHPKFNAVLSIILIGAIPMGIFVGSRLGINIYIWNAYYLAIFILEIVAIVKHMNMKSSNDITPSSPHSFESES